MNSSPLAHRMRPKKIEEIIGQEILKKGSLLDRMLRSKSLSSCVLWGPPATGKTSFINVVKEIFDYPTYNLNATYSKVSDIREIVEKNNSLENASKKSIVFIDEIHRFSKSQQDVLLPYVEDGSLIIVGLTTENPYFSVNKALLSRCLVFKFEQLKPKDILIILKRALNVEEKDKNIQIDISDDDLDLLSKYSKADIRFALNILDVLISTKVYEKYEEGEKDNIKIKINTKDITEALKDRKVSINRESEDHYNIISAFIKSIRGSDPDAAIYYLARLLENGEDPVFIARRLIISASEDIGLANPFALYLANSCYDAVSKIGMPEARIVLAEVTIYLAKSKKSNTAYNAINSAIKDMSKYSSLDIPVHIRNNPPRTLYKYPHDYPNSYVEQQYLPDDIKNIKYYIDKDNKDSDDNFINI